MTLNDKYNFNKYDICLIMVVCFVAFLLSYEHTSCTLLDPMTEIVKITVAFLFYIFSDRINWIIGSRYKLISLAE